MHSVSSKIAGSVSENKKNFYEERQSRHQMIGDLSNKLEKYIHILEQIEITIQDEQLSSEYKICTIKQLLPNTQKQEYNFLHEELKRLSKESSYIAKNDDYYAIIESKSVKLQIELLMLSNISSLMKPLPINSLLKPSIIISIRTVL